MKKEVKTVSSSRHRFCFYFVHLCTQMNLSTTTTTNNKIVSSIPPFSLCQCLAMQWDWLAFQVECIVHGNVADRCGILRKTVTMVPQHVWLWFRFLKSRSSLLLSPNSNAHLLIYTLTLFFRSKFSLLFTSLFVDFAVPVALVSVALALCVRVCR